MKWQEISVDEFLLEFAQENNGTVQGGTLTIPKELKIKLIRNKDGIGVEFPNGKLKATGNIKVLNSEFSITGDVGRLVIKGNKVSLDAIDNLNLFTRMLVNPFMTFETFATILSNIDWNS